MPKIEMPKNGVRIYVSGGVIQRIMVSPNVLGVFTTLDADVTIIDNEDVEAKTPEVNAVYSLLEKQERTAIWTDLPFQALEVSQ